ncbi:MAG: NADP-dependent malic enzyme [Caldisericia bacterium]|nr:NADP-dependent malic enzyme [Caldisericia bacterium]
MKRFDKYDEEALRLHKKYAGKIDIGVKADLRNKHALSVWYTPGVAHPCRIIRKNPETVYDYTIKGNSLAVITDGSRVLGLGNIGPEASIPVMEGKAALFVEFGGIDAFPIPLKIKTVSEFVSAVKAIEPMFGGINLEDISVPRCFEVEEALIRELDIPVFHDDQHGTAVVVLAGLINALKLMNRKKEDQKIVISGAGASGSAIAKLLISANFGDVILCDRAGAVYQGRLNHMLPYKEELAKISNKEGNKGSLKDCMKGADIFIGVACPGLVDGNDIENMAKNPIVFPLSNPDPDIDPDIAKKNGAVIVGTGRSDLPNQINNLCAFPGIMRGAMDSRASVVNEEMKMVAALAIANLLPENEMNPENIIVEPFRKGVAQAVGKAVVDAAFKTGVARTKLTKEEVYELIDSRLKGK